MLIGRNVRLYFTARTHHALQDINNALENTMTLVSMTQQTLLMLHEQQ